jgi:excisionase family DNA binding protein
MDPELFTFKETLEFLRISRSKLDRMIKNREVPFVKLGKRILFRKVDLDRLVESRLVKPE